MTGADHQGFSTPREHAWFCWIPQIQCSAEADHQSFENHSKSRTRKDQLKIENLKTRSNREPLRQVVGMHDQHEKYDVHAMQMEQSKIIKNTVQRTNPSILEKINQVRCKATVTASRPCRIRGRATRARHLPVDTQRKVPTTQKAQKVVNTVKILSDAVHQRDHQRSQ